MSDAEDTGAQKHSLVVAMLVGRELLRREFEAWNLPDPDDIVTQVFSQAVAQSEEPGREAWTALAASADAALNGLPEVADASEALIDVADAAADRNVELYGGGGKGSRLLHAAGALSLLLIVAKAKLNVDLRHGEFEFGLESGVPAGFETPAKDLVALVAAARGGSPPPPESAPPSGNEAIRSTPAVRVPFEARGHLPWGVFQRNWPTKPVLFEEGLRVRDQMFAAFEGREIAIAKAAEKTHGDLFNTPLLGFAKPGRDGRSLYWPDEHPFSFGVGLLPERQGESSDGPLTYSIAIRIQSPRELKPKVVRWISDELRKWMPLVSVRWTSPILALGSNDEGDYLPWAGLHPKHGKVASGAPLNVAGGAIGTCSMLLERGGEYFALTAGHPLRDTRKDAIGQTVYCRPQSKGGTSPEAEIGVVVDSLTFARTPLGAPTPSGAPGVDFALIKLSPRAKPGHGTTNLVDGRPIAKDFLTIPAAGELDAGAVARTLVGTPVAKSAAKSPMLTGHINAVALQVVCVDMITGASVTATGLVGVMMPQSAEHRPRPGDSGALLSTADPATAPQPVALLFGAQTAGRLERINAAGKMATSLYGVPLSAVAPLRGMRII